jgi:hypothetical protein
VTSHAKLAHPGTVLVAIAHRPLYYVSHLAAPAGASTVAFLVQPRLLNGEWLDAQQCPAIDVVLPDS